MARTWRILLLATLALWLGGLTFYALVVVPVGTQQLGATSQGFITERVTARLNWLACVVLLVVLVDLVRVRDRFRIALWLFMVLCQVALFLMHAQLRSLMDFRNHDVDSSFYAAHRIYLLVTAAQWLAGWACFASIVSAGSEPAAKSEQ
ncbi:MAG: hypothetical protein ACR2FY_23050 [Pirellulaceae bacterium]